MIINNLEQFVSIIPTATGTEWSSIEPFLISADAEIQNTLTGADLYNYIETLTYSNSIAARLRELIALTAYKNAIPFADLIQTPNGFGVVSNNNQAPASKERVERLIEQCKFLIDKTTDALISDIPFTPAALTEWTKFGKFKTLTNCLFWTGSDFSDYSESRTREDFLKVKSKILTAQKNELNEVIGTGYVNELIDKLRTNGITDKDKVVLENCKIALGNFVQNQEDEAEECLENLLNIIVDDIVSYPTYGASKQNAVRISEKYANKQADTTFFFGM